MSLTSSEFDSLKAAIKSKKLKTADAVLAYIYDKFVGTDVSSALGNTRAAMKNGVNKIVRKTRLNDNSVVRKREREEGFKMMSVEESQRGDELTKNLKSKKYGAQ